jgi:hypothetical protein
MSLDCSKLQRVRNLANGGCQAQCPACAEAGQDRKGEHLRISADGKFGCCVFPGDHEHRRRIFALAGDHGVKEIRVRVASAKTVDSVQLDLLGRLGQVFQSQNEECKNENDNSGTVGTGIQYPRAYAENVSSISKLKGSDEPVPSVPIEVRPPNLPEPGNVRLPYLTPFGDLVIPFNSPERYHWWKKGGQSLDATRQEILQRKESDASPF